VLPKLDQVVHFDLEHLKLANSVYTATGAKSMSPMCNSAQALDA